MAEIIKPKEIMVKNRDGEEKLFIISRLPAVAGREVLAKYPVANIPKLGEYKASEEAMRLLMSCVAVPREGMDPLRLTTTALIDNHVEDGEQLLRLEFEMLRYNTSFFGNAGNSGFVEHLIKTYLPLIMSTLMDSLPQSVRRDLQAGLNSKQA
jgi:hypothetical protein